MWEPKEPEDFAGDVKPGHRLLIKTAILMPSAKKDEVTVVEVESEGYNKKQVRARVYVVLKVPSREIFLSLKKYHVGCIDL